MPKKIEKKRNSVLRWLDNNILLTLSGFLLAFIPLFPKIPFFSPIEEYIVRVRAEDVLITVAILIWFVQLLRKKIPWKSPVSLFIGAYSLISLLSVISALYIIQTVPLLSLHVGKTALHYFRYLEYFSLFFILFSSVKSKKDVQILLTIIVLTVLGIFVYGVGQKYFYWPVYSTMNREFSKGIRLYLTEHARVQSTFAGHYDLAAYLVIVLPVVLALSYAEKNKWRKIGLSVIHVMGIWLLIVGAARTSFAAYGLAMGLVVLLFAWKQKTWLKKIWWGGSRLTLNLVLVSILLLGYGEDISERFLQIVRKYPQAVAVYDGVNKKRDGLNVQLKKIVFDGKSDSETTPTPPPNSISTEMAEVIVSSDQRPEPHKPIDVYVDVPDKVKVASQSADGTTEFVTIEKPRTWSENAKIHGLSLAIRLDTLWPQAVKGFMRSPLFGSGYATLNKTNVTEFTIAESTDNNFLRTLGETGLLGFLSFYGAVAAGIVVAAQQLKQKDRLLSAISIGYIGAAIGLLFNAVYIDVFASSKVAFTFWSLTGLLLGYVLIHHREKNRTH